MDDFAIYDTPIGRCRIESLCGEITALSFDAESSQVGQRSELSDMLYAQLMEYLRGERQEFDIPLNIDHLPPFTRRVLEELRSIPYGERRSYRDIAISIGSPRSSRAVGMACSRNPIAIIIPCHRDIASSGDLRGYAWGVDRKRHLLSLERFYVKI